MSRSARVLAGAPVALVDHARAESRVSIRSSGRYSVTGGRNGVATADDDRIAEHAQLVDVGELDRLRGQAGAADRDILVSRVERRGGLLGHRRLGEPGVALDAVMRATEDNLRERAPDVGERGAQLVVAQRRSVSHTSIVS